MIARGFKSVIWVATVGGAALSCYMVSLQVATERNGLEKVERQIIEAKRDIRSLQTELGTRGRLSQLEHWNAEVLALSAPTSAQFVANEFTLARLERREPTVADEAANVRLASVERTPEASPAPSAPVVVQAVAVAPARPAAPLVRQAGFQPAAATVEAKAKPAKPPAAAPENARTVTASASAPARPKASAAAATAAKKDQQKGARLGRLGDEIRAAASQEKGDGGN